MKKKAIIGITIACAGAAVAGMLLFKFKGGAKADPSQTAYVQPVSELMSGGELDSMFNFFAGVVESQDEVKVNKDQSDAEVKVKVKVGDEVKKGDVLFSYNADQYQSKIEQGEIDLERLKTELESAKATIEELNKEKAKAAAKDQGSYTLQIQEEELEQKEKEYEIKSKKKELKALKKSVKDVDVKSEVDGVIKAINDKNTDEYSGDTESAFIVITQKGDYRIKGTVNEQNISDISQGTNLKIRARVGEGSWTGHVSKVDTEHTNTNENEMYSEGSEEGGTSYPFYVELDSSEGLILGQHVYMMVDYGQGEAKEGIWLPEYMIDNPEEDASVWVDKGGKIEKQKIELGEYDEELMSYQIKSGLEETDKIAMPEEYLKEGMVTAPMEERPAETEMSTDEEMMSDDEMMSEDGMEFSDDEMYMDDEEGEIIDESGSDFEESYEEATEDMEVEPDKTDDMSVEYSYDEEGLQ